MAELERIEVERIERNKYRFYRVLGSEDRQAGRSITDAHLFAPGELLELAAYVEQNRGQLEQEAHEDEERDARAWSEDMKDLEQIKRVLWRRRPGRGAGLRLDVRRNAQDRISGHSALRVCSPLVARSPSHRDAFPQPAAALVADLRYGVAARVATTRTGTASESGQDRHASTATLAARRERDRLGLVLVCGAKWLLDWIDSSQPVM